MLLPALPSASGPFVGPGDRYPNRQLKTKSVPVWLLADSQPHSLHSLKRFFWRRSIVINHFGSKGASPALPSAPPCTEARRGPILARKRWASGIAASTLSSSGARPNPCSPTTKPEFPFYQTMRFLRDSQVGNRLHITICVRDLVLASVFGSEHQTRYRGEPHIRILSWDEKAIGHFLVHKLQKLNDQYFIDSTVKGRDVSTWLGLNHIENVERNVSESAIDYIMRHTRLLPRDIVIIGNLLSREILNQKGKVGKPELQQIVRNTVSEAAKIFGN